MGKKIFTKKCATCGSEFAPGRHKEKLNCSAECLKIYQNVHKNDRIKKAKEALREKYGVDHPSKIIGHMDKVKKTKEEKYGDKNYNNRKQAETTKEKKYGDKKFNNRKRAKITKKEKYDDENYNNREKANKTILEKFGVKHHLQAKESMDKQKKTNLERYNEECAFKTENCIDARKKVNMELYGVEYFFSSDKHKKRAYNKKLKDVTKLLEKSNIKFDLKDYTKIRNKHDDGIIEYIMYNVECEVCGYKFKASLKNQKIICRNCFPIDTADSKFQRDMNEFLTEHGVDFMENNRHLIKPLEVDFYIRSHNLAIELNGNYWHSEDGGGKNRKYHLDKTELCQKRGVKLIQIFEDEWMFKKDIVKSRLLNELGKTKKRIYARKCVIKEVDNKIKKEFLEENHIQGDSVDKIRLGLFESEELVSIMTFSKKRIALGGKDEKGSLELNRFCSKINTSVVGGFQKLLSHFIKNYSPKKITTYADCRWSGLNPEDTIYQKSGFEFIGKTPPSFFYIKVGDYINRKHRFSLVKHKLLELYGGDKSKTAQELAIEAGYDRIWDCGTLKFKLNINS